MWLGESLLKFCLAMMWAGEGEKVATTNEVTRKFVEVTFVE
jgi:hypothetical protein